MMGDPDDPYDGDLDASSRSAPKPKQNRRRSGKQGAGEAASPFIEIADRVSTHIINGKRRRLTHEEALKQQIYNRAICGSSPDVKAVLDWISERDAARPPPKRSIPQFRIETSEYGNIDQALMLLNIVIPTPKLDYADRSGFQLDTGLINRALAKIRRRLSLAEIDEIRTRAEHPVAIMWPEDDDE